MRKTKEMIIKKWEQKYIALRIRAEQNHRILESEYKKKIEKEREKKIERKHKKMLSYLARKKLEYDRKCKNEIRELEGKPQVVYKGKAKTRNQLLNFALDISQENSKLRDSNKDGISRCISCGKQLKWTEADGGHYRSRIIQAVCLRPENIHAQCKSCNWIMGTQKGTIAEAKVTGNYTKNLIQKIGGELFLQMKDLTNMWYKNPEDNSPTYSFLLDQIPELIAENEKLRATKSFYKPKKNRRKLWNSFNFSNNK